MHVFTRVTKQYCAEVNKVTARVTRKRRAVTIVMAAGRTIVTLHSRNWTPGQPGLVSHHKVSFFSLSLSLSLLPQLEIGVDQTPF